MRETGVTEPPKATVRGYEGADEDASLVARAAAGEPGAFDALFEAHYARVFNFAVRLTASRDAAEDIAQSAFVRAYEGIGRMREGRAFLKLMYRIVVNLVRDRARTSGRKPWVAIADLLRGRRHDRGWTDEEPDLFADPDADPAQVVEHWQMERALAQHIVRLPLEFRTVLVLHHIEGLDVRQIAATLGVPEGTVKSRLGRARARLREAMASWMT